MRPTARQAGYIIGRSIHHMPMQQLAGAADDQVLLAAGCSRPRLLDEFLLLAAAASMHAIETAGLSPVAETDVATGLYDWMREQPAATAAFLLEHIEPAVESYAQAAKDELAAPKSAGHFTELEREFIDRLLALGEESEARARACCELGAAAQTTLWEVVTTSASSTLQEAGQVGARDA